MGKTALIVLGVGAFVALGVYAFTRPSASDIATRPDASQPAPDHTASDIASAVGAVAGAVGSIANAVNRGNSNSSTPTASSGATAH